jgi:PAS domain S-box-containing protein
MRTTTPVSSPGEMWLSAPRRLLGVVMTLRKKTVIYVGAVLVVGLAVLYLAAGTIMLASFSELEERDTRQNVHRVVNALEDEVSALNDKSADWAVWDDAYGFMEDRNPEFIQSNLSPRTFSDLKLSFMLFIDTDGEVVLGRGFDLQAGREAPYPESLLRQEQQSSFLLAHPDPESSKRGVMLLPEGPVLVSSRPIVTSEGKGPIRGTLIMGRYITDAGIARLGETTRLSVSGYRFDEKQLPPEWQAARNALAGGESVVVRMQDEETVEGYTAVKDVYGNPAFLLRVDSLREIHQRGIANLRYIVLAILVLGLALGAATSFLLEKLVLRRLAYLSAEVTRIGISGDTSARVLASGSDELSRLSVATNEMLAALHESVEALRQSKEQAENILELLESITDPFFALDNHWRFVYMNPLAERLLQGTREELLGRNVWEAFPESLSTKAADECSRSVAERVPVEFELYHPDLAAWYNVHVFPYKDGLSMYWREVTRRKQAEEALRRNMVRS